MEESDLISADELVELDRLLDEVSARAKRRITYEHLVESWEKAVSQIEQGYPLTIYDYQEDISRRSILEDLVLRAPEKLSPKLRNHLTPIDDRFRKATTVAKTSVMPIEWDQAQWWGFRVPRVLLPDLEKDLRARSLLSD